MTGTRMIVAVVAWAVALTMSMAAGAATVGADEPAAGEPAPGATADAEARLLALVNRDRVGVGVRSLVRRDDVAVDARAWSRSMGDVHTLSHNRAFFSAQNHRRLHAARLGQNVARATTIAAAHRALMSSPDHRANLLDARFRAVGIGVDYVDGSWWITQDFVEPA